jgi:hypothetical protein
MIPILQFLSMVLIVKTHNINTRILLSNFKIWNQKPHTKQWLTFAKNIRKHLSIDKTSLLNDKPYTILTNKAGKDRKGDHFRNGRENAVDCQVIFSKYDSYYQSLQCSVISYRSFVKIRIKYNW